MFKEGQVVFDKLNDAYVRLVHVFEDDIQVEWLQEDEISSYHLLPGQIRELTDLERGETSARSDSRAEG